MCWTHNLTVTRAKLLAKQVSGIRHEKKKHTSLPPGCWRHLVPICLRFAVFDERALLGTLLLLSLIESDLTVISTLSLEESRISHDTFCF